MNKWSCGLVLVFLGFSFHCETPNTIEEEEPIPLEMTTIASKGKEFSMGYNKGHFVEIPEHIVHFTYDFEISKTEITQGEYEAIMGKNYSQYRGVNIPVHNVTFFDAMLYCNKKSKLEGYDTVYSYNKFKENAEQGCYYMDTVIIDTSANGYRIPTEAEWEYACRGGTKTQFYWDDEADPDKSKKYAWFYSNSELKPHPVGEKKPNNYDLYDISGNVWEWVQDWFRSYSGDTLINPCGPPKGIQRVIRGGSWRYSLENCRSSFRDFIHQEYRNSYLGFRITRTL